MKFSYNLLKKLAPEIKSKNELAEKLSLFVFEVDDISGDTIDIKILPNRYSDAISHIGIAREISAIYGSKKRASWPKGVVPGLNKKVPLKIKIDNNDLCPRYSVVAFENVSVTSSPKWMQDALKSCGMRPINSVVDVMNYVMLEVGQPLHAFDLDKIENKSLTVRQAKKSEKIITLDNEGHELDSSVLVIADDNGPLAIAGIKGGKRAEVNKDTKRIVIEAASFSSENIFKSYKKLNLPTDASVRFAHNLSPELVGMALTRAAELLKEISGAKVIGAADFYPKKQGKKVIKFNLEKFNSLIGVSLDFKSVSSYLKALDFKITKALRLKDKQGDFLVEVPALRQDINIFEDLTEEVIRLCGLNNLKSVPPVIALHSSGFEDQIIVKDKVRQILTALGFSEVYNHSFVSESDLKVGDFWKYKRVELKNPVSAQYQYLRPNLLSGVIQNIKDNFRFFDEVKIFEIGDVFFEAGKGVGEETHLVIAFGNQKQSSFLELKGAVNELFAKSGVTDYYLNDQGHFLKIESNDQKVLGFIEEKKDKNGFFALAEINLKSLIYLAEENFEYQEIPKYPAVERDISILVDKTIRVGAIMEAISYAEIKLIEDVDLVDSYESDSMSENRKSLTFRIVFQASDRTLTDEEVSKVMEKINLILNDNFNAEIR